MERGGEKTMHEKEREILLDDYFSLPSKVQDPDLVAIEAALFIEQAFGLELSDGEISPATLGSEDAVRRLVASRLEGR
jgi:hypothetical protein